MTCRSPERIVLGRTAVTAGRQPIEVDARLIGAGLGLEPAQVPPLMEAGKITLLCERGMGEDQGCHRVTFYWARRRFRILIDSSGRIFEDS